MYCRIFPYPNYVFALRRSLLLFAILPQQLVEAKNSTLYNLTCSRSSIGYWQMEETIVAGTMVLAAVCDIGQTLTVEVKMVM